MFGKNLLINRFGQKIWKHDEEEDLKEGKEEKGRKCDMKDSAVREKKR